MYISVLLKDVNFKGSPFNWQYHSSEEELSSVKVSFMWKQNLWQLSWWGTVL